MEFNLVEARLCLALQIIHHPSNALAEFVSCEMDRVVALAKEDHDEAVRSKGTKRVLVLCSTSENHPVAGVSTNPSTTQTKDQSGPVTRTRNSIKHRNSN